MAGKRLATRYVAEFDNIVEFDNVVGFWDFPD